MIIKISSELFSEIFQNVRDKRFLNFTIIAPANRNKSLLQVAMHKREWKEGKVLVFDDSFEHEAFWSYCDGGGGGCEENVQDRVVLILDFFHPGLNTNQRRGRLAKL